MSYVRIIACLLYSDGKLVQSINFRHPVVIGNAITKIQYFNSWQADEIYLINISKNESSLNKFYEVVEQLSKISFIPLAIGGWIKSKDQARYLLSIGADKIILNTQGFKNPNLITNLANEFGSQFVSVSIDSKKFNNNDEVFINRGSESTGIKTLDWCIEAEKYGAGEIFLNSIDHDGLRKGYNINLMKNVKENIKIPLVCFGGIWEWSHLSNAIDNGMDALGIGNVLHFREHSIIHAKKYLKNNGYNVRKPEFFNYNYSRNPNYDDVL